MHLLAILEYDGTEFLGFQSQKSGRTVQDELEHTLAEFLPKAERAESRNRVKIIGGGRTDTGVHAHGQTATFDLEWTRDLETLSRAWNAKLPTDIFVRQLAIVPERFSARFSAVSRRYEYRVWNHRERSVFHCRYAHWVYEPLNVPAMQLAAQALIGHQDFGAFGSAPQGSDSTVRDLRRVEIEQVGNEIIFTFEANAFLYRMVRRMVGTLLLVGRDVMSPQAIGDVIQRKRRSGFAAPPQGLTLMEIKYE